MRPLNFLKSQAQAVQQALSRFSVPFVASLFMAGLILVEANNLSSIPHDIVARLIYLGLMVFSLFIGAQLFAERTNRVKTGYSIATALLILLGVLVFVEPLFGTQAWTLLCLSITIGLLWLATPYFTKGDSFSFINFHILVALSFISANVLMLFFIGGVIGLLASIENLFGLSTSDRTYMNLWIICSCFIAPVLALGHLPKEFDSECNETKYVHVLGWFFVPLAFAYLAILYLYGFKIVVTQVWPSNFIGYLVPFSILGGMVIHFLSHLAVAGNSPLMSFWRRWFYPLTIGPLGLLAGAAYLRISAYGLTEERYLLVLFIVWCAVLFLIYTLRPKTHIKWVVFVCAGLAILISYGPLTPMDRAYQSQEVRFMNIINKHNLLQNGQVQPPKQALPYKDQKILYSVVSYIYSAQRDSYQIAKIKPRRKNDKERVFNALFAQLGENPTKQKVLNHLKINEIDIKETAYRRGRNNSFYKSFLTVSQMYETEGAAYVTGRLRLLRSSKNLLQNSQRVSHFLSIDGWVEGKKIRLKINEEPVTVDLSDALRKKQQTLFGGKAEEPFKIQALWKGKMLQIYILDISGRKTTDMKEVKEVTNLGLVLVVPK